MSRLETAGVAFLADRDSDMTDPLSTETATGPRGPETAGLSTEVALGPLDRSM